MAEYIDWILYFLFLTAGSYVIVVLEKYFFAGKLDFKSPVRGLARYFITEDVKPEKRDKVFYEVSPFLFIAAVLLAVSVIPLGENLVIVRMATGALFLNAALAYIMVSMLMAGWSANGVYSMIGGWRFLGQLIAYSMPVVMTITAAVMRAESINLFYIVESQEKLWNVLYQPLGFILFYLSAMALSFIPPFDLPVAEGELAGGAWSEFTGIRMLIFRLGRLLLVLTLSVATVVLFFGGWYGPFLPGYLWILIKTFLVAASFFILGKKLSRINHDQMLSWSWKYFTPAALLNIFIVGVLLLL